MTSPIKRTRKRDTEKKRYRVNFHRPTGSASAYFSFFFLSPSLVEKETMGGGTGRKKQELRIKVFSFFFVLCREKMSSYRRQERDGPRGEK